MYETQNQSGCLHSESLYASMKLARQSQLYAVYVMYIYTSLTNSIMVKALIHQPLQLPQLP